MTDAQVTHVRIDNDGPWRVRPESRREVDPRTLRPRLFADAYDCSATGTAVFLSRSDDVIAVSNGLDTETRVLEACRAGETDVETAF